MPRHLTEPEAWRAIAEKLLNEGGIAAGLCREVADVFLDGVVSLGIAQEMKDRLSRHLEDARAANLVFGGYVYGGATERDEYGQLVFSFGHGRYHEERALACLWMALEAEE